MNSRNQKQIEDSALQAILNLKPQLGPALPLQSEMVVKYVSPNFLKALAT